MSRPCSDPRFVQLVYEYLLHMGMEGTASQFKQECNARNIPNPNEPDGIKKAHITDLVQLFDEENEYLFFEVFNSVIPQELHYSPEYKIMMADLLVYFAALSILKEDLFSGNFSFKPLVHAPPRMAQHFETGRMLALTPNLGPSHSRTDYETLQQYDMNCGSGCGAKNCHCSQETLHSTTYCARNPAGVRHIDCTDRTPVHPAMRNLLSYLERECSNLKDHPQMATHFALPFAPHPQSHPRFKHIFQDSWAANLRRKLWDFLVVHRQAAKVPDIVLLLSSKGKLPPKYSSSCPTSSGKAHRLGPVTIKSQPSTYETELVSNAFATLPLESILDHCVPEVLASHSSLKCYEANLPDQAGKSAFSSFDPTSREHNESDSSLMSYLDCKHHDHLMSLRDESDHVISSSKCQCHTIQYIPCRKSKEKSAPPSPHHGASMTKPAVQATHHSSYLQAPETHPNYENLKLKYNQLHSDYHNLIGVAAELTFALESNLRGRPTDVRHILKNCIQNFPALFYQNSNFDTTEKACNGLPTQTENSDIGASLLYTLDINKIQSTLIEGSVKARLFLLQALRWRITQTSSNCGKITIREYVEGDVLQLNGERKSVLECILAPINVQTPQLLQQAAARFVNTLASLKSGRDYLAHSSYSVVDIVSDVLKKCSGKSTDDVTKKMLVASLQKLSLRYNQRIAMIEAGLVEWLVEHLSNVHKDCPDPYMMEYCCALLMNLCLHLSAKQRCLPIAEPIISLLFDLRLTTVSKALPYINGTIFSLLSYSELNATVARFGLASTLELKIKQEENPDEKKQLEHILHFHKKLLLPESNLKMGVGDGEMIDGDNEEIDLLEDELDNNDPVQSISGEPTGETLLLNHYTTSIRTQAHADVETTTTLAGVDDSFILIRPATPLYGPYSAVFSEDSEGVVIARTKKEQSSHLKERRKLLSTMFQGPKIENDQSKPLRSSSSNRGRLRRSNTTRERKPILMDHNHLKKRPQTYYGKVDAVNDKSDLESSTSTPELPEITIDYASTRERSSDENDSDDVQVEMAPQSTDLNLCSVKNDGDHEFRDENVNFKETSVTTANDDEKGSDGSAFVSRPKIPRTPPH